MEREYLMYPNGYAQDICREALAELPALAQPPARMTAQGMAPLSADTVVIESESPAKSTFMIDTHEPLFTEQDEDGTLRARTFAGLRSNEYALLSTRATPQEPYQVSFRFRTDRPVKGDLWVFEQGRAWASPFRWRIDDGPLTEVGITSPMLQWTSWPDGPTFAWSQIGKADIGAGEHTLSVSVDTPKDDGHYLLAHDCYMLVPEGERPKAILHSGDRRNLVARCPAGKGELIISQVLMDGRVQRDAQHYDPGIERLFLNLLRLGK
jgi:hypothetical protein